MIFNTQKTTETLRDKIDYKIINYQLIISIYKKISYNEPLVHKIFNARAQPLLFGTKLSEVKYYNIRFGQIANKIGAYKCT